MTQLDTDNPLTAEFERLRPYLLGVAYSHLGSITEAEDVVQEGWLRLRSSDRAEIRNLRAWLTTVVSRLAIDALTSARARREHYVGPWLPEPVVEARGPGADPAGRIDLDESVSMALLIVLEALSPAERSAFLLHDVFGYSFAEVARIVGRTPQATRQLATRARQAVEARRPRYPAGSDEQREVVSAFHAATENGDLAALIELLDPAVTFRSDGGGRVNAARKVFTGAERVGRIFTAMAGHFGDRFRMSPIGVNGKPGLLMETGGSLTVIAFTLDRDRICEINLIRNPDKLTTVRAPMNPGPSATVSPGGSG
jgi:RNA polymerase sigma-70 factor, ECF subfamily